MYKRKAVQIVWMKKLWIGGYQSTLLNQDENFKVNEQRHGDIVSTACW